MKVSRPAFSRQAGFSYLWVLLLVALMGVGLTVAVEMDSTVSQRDREKALLATGRQFQVAIGHYYEGLQTGGRNEYPASLEDLLQDPRYPGTMRHLRKIFVDPMTGKAEWGLVRIGGRIVGVHSLSGKTPIKQANFEAEVSHFAGAQKYTDWVFTYPPDLILKSGGKEEGITASPFTPQGVTNSKNFGSFVERMR
ncbi:MAG: type II secretion system protein [Zoogloeaceae bacterium]|jgi:type II secretory pathway pseudopilin PulG|nr:type II secretion system protein [Zoogloeaceae bacterium]